MSGYVPKVGDRVRRRSFPTGHYADVLCVFGNWMWVNEAGNEDPYSTDQHVRWEPYVEPVVYPERWINVYPHGCHQGHMTRSLAEEGKSDGRIGVLHLLPDGSTVMEAP